MQTIATKKARNFVDLAHQPIVLPGVVANGGSSAVDLQAGLVLARVTATNQLTPWAPGAEDGSEKPAALLVADVTIPAGGEAYVDVYAHGLFAKAGIDWNGASDAQIKTAMNELAIAGVYVK